MADFRVSATGGLSGEAGSSITVTLPAGTGTDQPWQSGTVRDVTRHATSVLPAPDERRHPLPFFSSGAVNATTSCRSSCAG